MNGLDFGTAIGLIKGLGSPDPAVIESAVSDWLDDHPEATTTVQDGSITKAKLDNNLQGTVEDVANLKSALSSVEEYIGGLKAPFTTTATDLFNTATKTDFSAKSGEKIRIKVDVDDQSSIYVYFYFGNSTTATSQGSIQNHTWKEYILADDINAVSIYVTGMTSGAAKNIALYVENLSDYVTGEINDLRNDFIVSEQIFGNYTFSTSDGRLNCKYGRLKNGGKLTLSAVPAGYQIGFQVYPNADYKTAERIYDSGWQSTVGFSFEINPNYYYRTTIKGSSAITDISVAEEFVLTQTYNVKTLSINNKSDISTLGKRIPMLSSVVKSIAHRGDQIIGPKNTAPAYIIARNNGFTIAENDVTVSSDGEYVCWHDSKLTALGSLYDINGYLMYTDGTDFYYVSQADNSVYTWDGTDYVASAVSLASLTRCQGTNYTPSDLSLAILKRIDFGVYKGSNFFGTQILTFAEWVLLCKELGLEIYIDRKIDYTTEQLTELAQIVKQLGMGRYSSWLQLTTAQAQTLRTIIPDARIGVLAIPSDELIEQWESYNTGRGVFFNGSATSASFTAQNVQKGLNAGFDVEVYYVDYSDTESTILSTIRSAVGYGVTAMTLDHYSVDDAFYQMREQY